MLHAPCSRALFVPSANSMACRATFVLHAAPRPTLTPISTLGGARYFIGLDLLHRDRLGFECSVMSPV
jgi:hypothetical protein